MGAKKIGNGGGLMQLPAPAPLISDCVVTAAAADEALPTYSAIYRKGLLGGQAQAQAQANGRSGSATERPGETGESKVNVMGVTAAAAAQSSLSLSLSLDEICPRIGDLALHLRLPDREPPAPAPPAHPAGAAATAAATAPPPPPPTTPATTAAAAATTTEAEAAATETAPAAAATEVGEEAAGNSEPNSDMERLQPTDRERDMRPPALIVPDSGAEADFAAQAGGLEQAAEQGGDNLLGSSPSPVLPASLAGSPGAGRRLNPNAPEFTPSSSPVHSPVFAHAHGVLPLGGNGYAPMAYMQPMLYGPEFGGSAGMPVFTNGAPSPFVSLPVSGPPWEPVDVPVMSTAPIPTFLPMSQPHYLPQYLHPPHPQPQPQPSFNQPPPGPPHSLPPHPPLHPCRGDHVSRALLIIGLRTDITEAQLLKTLELWGNVRALASDRLSQGVVGVQYFDLRHAKEAHKEIQHQHVLHQHRMRSSVQEYPPQQQHQVCYYPEGLPPAGDASYTMDLHNRGLIGGKAVWAQFVSPAEVPVAGPDSMNQGTLVVFNLDADTSLEDLQQAFERHGNVKEVRETPLKKQHRFVEFFDIRDASRALTAMDGQEIAGKRVKIEFSRPGGAAQRQLREAQAQAQAETGHPVPYIDAGVNASSVPGPSHRAAVYVPRWGHEGGIAPGPPLSAGFPCNTPPIWWGNYRSSGGNMVHAPHIQSTVPTPATGQAVASSPGILPLTDHQVPVGRPGDRGTGGSFYQPRSFGGLHNSGTGRGGCNFIGRRRGGAVNGGSFRHQPNRANGSANGKTSGEGSVGSGDGRRRAISGSSSRSPARELQHSHYVFDEREAVTSGSPRTTLMIKNIPNKYCQGMLLGLLDDHCMLENTRLLQAEEARKLEGESSLLGEDGPPPEPQSAYNFVYLPIDFKNRCNLGYAFVNLTTVQAAVRLYRAFDSQQWHAFNSRKVCQVTYARVQGYAALVEHFRNSRFACDTSEYLPLNFPTPRTGLLRPNPEPAATHMAPR